MRAPRAVTHFSPGSYAARPAQETGLRNLFLAGDWVKGVPHGANGLSQVRSLGLTCAGGRILLYRAQSTHVWLTWVYIRLCCQTLIAVQATVVAQH